MKIPLISALLFCTALGLHGSDLPRLDRSKPGAVKLIVDGKPFLMLGGETMNSSSSTLESMAPKWGTLRNLNLNTVLLPVSWQQVEPEEGAYDFSIVEGLVKEARKHDLKLVVLWFGSWKNAFSGYAPHWVLRDTKRFPRMQDEKGQNRAVLSNLSDELNRADARAFTAMMEFIRSIDSQEHTVIMCQIENEVGIRGDSRDRSATAEKLFRSEVPAELMNHISSHQERIWPEIIERWTVNGRKAKGSWTDVFGQNDLADELFMAWHYAGFVERMAADAKRVYPLPLFVNAWTIDPQNPKPGVYPSGGPNHRMLDVWQVGAPSVDVIAVDNYRKDYKSMSHHFHRSGNPLFVPEAVPLWQGDSTSGPAKAFYTYGEFNTIGFSPFAIDHPVYDEKHPMGKAYEVLRNLTPLILAEQGTGRMRGFMRQDTPTERISFGDYELEISYKAAFPGYGLVIRLAEDEFLLAGNGADFVFRSLVPGRAGLSYGTIREGYFERGEWKTTKYLGGDEAGQGVRGIKLPGVYLKDDVTPSTITIVRVKVIPVEGGSDDRTLRAPEALD